MKTVIKYNMWIKFWKNQTQIDFWNKLTLNCQLILTLIFKPNYISYKGPEILLDRWSRINLASVFWVIKKTETTSHVNGKPTTFDQFVTFINIWPISQWVFSLITLVIMYWLIGLWYNQRLKKQGGWISWQARLIMIFLDLTINLVLGIYYMSARETFMGQIMLRCPIAISPLIFLIEFLVFVWYYKKTNNIK